MEKINTMSAKLTDALKLPRGAQFYRCALQVNPYGYLQRHDQTSAAKFKDEAEYNQAILNACKELDINVIGVTDHYRVNESVNLLTAAKTAGIFAFHGFEAVSKDGVHILCLFDPDKVVSDIERIIGLCGITSQSQASPVGDKDCHDLLKMIKAQGGICIAAHAVTSGGILDKLSGQTRINVWKSPDLLACAINTPIDQVGDQYRPILENKEQHHRRERPVAVINARDVNSPDDLKREGSSCLIKMSVPSVEGLRQAFLDPLSRIRLNHEDKPEPHAEFLAMAWEGGFLRDTAIHFNENLNVLVGGRGAGKSTIIESLRYVLGLEPLGIEARNSHESVVKNVLSSGTKISLLVKSHHPSLRYYTIERTVPNPPVVKDEAGNILTLSPKEVVPGVEVFGQHEISELTKSKDKLTLLLNRFVERDPTLYSRKSQLKLELEKSRSRILDTQREITVIKERLTALPALEETLKRFQAVGLQERLKEKSLLVREESILATAYERISEVRELGKAIAENLPVDAAFVNPKTLEGLPNAASLQGIETAFVQLNKGLQAIVLQFEKTVEETKQSVDKVKSTWDAGCKAIEEKYEKLLRELQKSKIDGNEFIQLQKQIELLKPLKDKLTTLERDLKTHNDHRRKILDEWETLKAEEHRAIVDAAKKVTKKLDGRVRVEVTMSGNRDPLERLLRDEVGGNLNAAVEHLKSRPQISLPDLAAKCREGRDALTTHYSIPQGAAERIAQSDPSLFMKIEELELMATTKIELNTAPDEKQPEWQTLDALSTGQKATAVLLLLLLESDAPLVVDQPEDDLDNRFITDGVVPTMSHEKTRRQFLFSTHNANIPVLGDAELIVGLTALGEGKEGHARMSPQYMGSIDSKPVRELVEEILEGGKMAFEMRRLKYGF